jgi:hypothetical protein
VDKEKEIVDAVTEEQVVQDPVNSDAANPAVVD